MSAKIILRVWIFKLVKITNHTLASDLKWQKIALLDGGHKWLLQHTLIWG